MIDLGGAFNNINTTLNGLLSKYSNLRFVGFDQAQDNKRIYLTSVITSFYYKARRQPITGEVVERLKIVTDGSTIDSAIRKGSMIELSDSNGNFVRFKLKVIKEPNPPTMEWYLEITPNRDDKTTIT